MEPFETGIEFLVVVERMCDLIHDKIWVFKKAEYSIIKLNGNVISVFFHAERAEEEVFHPVIIKLPDDGHKVLCFDNFAYFDPCRPKERKLINTLN